MSITKVFASFAGGSALLALAYTVAQALCIGCPPPGSTMTCGNNIFSCQATVSTTTGLATFITNAVVRPTFKVVGGNRGGETPASTSLQPLAWKGTGNSPTLGAVTWEFDLNRGVNNTTITANQTSRDFPATADIRFHIRGTIAAYPGVTFESVTPLDVRGTVNSFDPFVNETFTLAAPVQFRAVNNPDGPSFTMTALTLKLNG